MNEREWDRLRSLQQCCVIQSNADTGQLYHRRVLQTLDTKICGCSDYANRKDTCPIASAHAEERAKLDWLPQTCAYRLVPKAKTFWWHLLISGSQECPRLQRISAQQDAPKVLKMPGLIKRITRWPTPLKTARAARRRRRVKR
jgi:hypothetical protein